MPSHSIVTPAWITRRALIELSGGTHSINVNVPPRYRAVPSNLHDGAWFVAEAEKAAKHATMIAAVPIVVIAALILVLYAVS